VTAVFTNRLGSSLPLGSEYVSLETWDDGARRLLTHTHTHTWTAPLKSTDQLSLSSMSEMVSIQSDSGRADPRTVITWPGAEVAQSLCLLLTDCTYTHTHTHNHFTALWILSGTTRVSRYQKKHSPIRTYYGHQSSLICFIHLLSSMASSLFNLHAWQSFSTISLQSPSFLWSTSWLGTIHFIHHTFLHPIIVFFSQHMPMLNLGAYWPLPKTVTVTIICSYNCFCTSILRLNCQY